MIRFLILFGGLLALASPSLAQSSLTDAQVRATIDVVLDNIGGAICGRAQCAPSTAAERRSPPVSLVDARRVIARGQLSALAEWCGLNWQQRSYLPLMQAERAVGRSDRAIAIIGVMHGYVLGQARQSLRGQSCSAQERAGVERSLAQLR